MKAGKTQEYRFGLLKEIYSRHIQNGGNSETVEISMRTERLAYRYLAKRGFISCAERKDGLFKVFLLPEGINYIKNAEKD
ncbi:hypothetical protein P4S83_17530 [Aneurinibacillus thermoaerophilus]|uniref:hypothetical protein n=1 Tax=Aneurinibacillus thermoaerophilus TaxID=143495 RepID=UPI002E1AA965|nr:hypothetical protein [Aneurinibacillus thermoaerophilus]MED0765285.1 hypothetical protein [Aneurinibacillus thermoaerophilus]